MDQKRGNRSAKGSCMDDGKVTTERMCNELLCWPLKYKLSLHNFPHQLLLGLLLQWKFILSLT